MLDSSQHLLKTATQQPAVDPSQLANPIALAFSVPAHLMTCWRLMSRAPQGQRRYHLCPTTMTFKICLWSSGYLSSFFSSSPLLNDGMENEKWGLILKYQFPSGSPFTYRLSVSCVVPLRFYLLQPSTYHLRAVCKILVLNFSLGYYWVASPCLNKHCSALMA